MKITRVPRAVAPLLATAVLAGSGCCPIAAALEPGVHVDPGSPAAKEYAIPLSQARQTGQGGSTGAGASGALFGTGISAKRAQSVSQGSGARRGTPRGGPHDAGRLGSARTAVAMTVSGVLARRDSSGAASDSALALLGGGVLVLVLGAFLGVVLRGRPAFHSTQDVSGQDL